MHIRVGIGLRETNRVWTAWEAVWLFAKFCAVGLNPSRDGKQEDKKSEEGASIAYVMRTS